MDVTHTLVSMDIQVFAIWGPFFLFSFLLFFSFLFYFYFFIFLPYHTANYITNP